LSFLRAFPKVELFAPLGMVVVARRYAHLLTPGLAGTRAPSRASSASL
jgi:hypothetical protein